MLYPNRIGVENWILLHHFQSFFKLALMTLGLLFVATSRTLAQETVTIPFSGSVTGFCQFSNVTSGTLGLSNDGQTLSSNLSGGSVGNASIVCNEFGRIAVQIETPTQSSSLPVTIVSSRAIANIEGEGFNWFGFNNPFTRTADTANNDLASLPAFLGLLTFVDADIEIDMEVTNDSLFPDGDYVFTVRLSAVSN